MIHTAQLSRCVQEYALAASDPFDGPLACLPSEFPPLPSAKFKVWSKGSGTTGTQNGFVMVSPSRMVATGTDAVAYSNDVAAYVQDGFPATITDAGVATAGANAGYPSGSFGSGSGLAKYRVIGCGLRAWYSGSELDLSGNILALRHPDNNSLFGNSRNDAQFFSGCRRIVNTTERNVVSVVYIPVNPEDITYDFNLARADYCLGIIFETKTGVSNAFAWEAFAIYELVGKSVPNRTISHADPEGFSAVLSALQTKGDTFVGSIANSAKQLLTAAYQEMASMSGPLMQKIGRASGRFGMNTFTQAIGLGPGGPGALFLEGDSDPSADGRRPRVTVSDAEKIGRIPPTAPPVPEISVPDEGTSDNGVRFGPEGPKFDPARFSSASNVAEYLAYQAEARLAVERAKSDAANAQREAQRLVDLYAKGFGSRGFGAGATDLTGGLGGTDTSMTPPSVVIKI